MPVGSASSFAEFSLSWSTTLTFCVPNVQISFLSKYTACSIRHDKHFYVIQSAQAGRTISPVVQVQSVSKCSPRHSGRNHHEDTETYNSIQAVYQHMKIKATGEAHPGRLLARNDTKGSHPVFPLPCQALLSICCGLQIEPASSIEGKDLVDHKAHRSHTKLIGTWLYDRLKRHVKSDI